MTGEQHHTTIIEEADRIIRGFLRKRGYTVLIDSDVEMPVTKKMRRRQPQKEVSFSTYPHVYLQSYSESDLVNSWYQKSDYTKFVNECKGVLRESDAVGGDFCKIDSALFCVRGLEDHVIPSLSYVKQKRRRLLIRLIVSEYKIQKGMSGQADDEKLRDMSILFSTRSRSWAMELGTLDAQGSQRRKCEKGQR